MDTTLFLKFHQNFHKHSSAGLAVLKKDPKNDPKCVWKMFSPRSEKAFRKRRFKKFPGVSLLSSASKKGRTWEHGPGSPVQTPFVTLLLRTLRAFGKGVSEKAFYLEVPWGVPFLFRRQKGTYLGTQGTYHLKLLFWNSFSEHPISGPLKNISPALFNKFQKFFTAHKFSTKNRGGTNRVFGKPCFCPLPKRGHFDENGEKGRICILPTEKPGLRSSDPRKRRKWRKWRVSLRKRHGFRESRVCSSLTLGCQAHMLSRMPDFQD